MPLASCCPIELTEHRDLVQRHDTEEAVRLAYVAATRAREMLVVPVVGDAVAGEDSTSGWLDVLHPALFPAPMNRRRSSPAPGCPAFGEDSVYERPEATGRGAESAVRPGLHEPEAGEHAVVWWDPHVLELDKQDDVGLRQQRILAADQGEVAAGEGERLHRQWVSRRTALIVAGETPSFRVTPVTAAAVSVDALPATAAVRETIVERTDASRGERPHGKRFGILVHAILQAVDLAAGSEEIAKTALAHGRLVNAPELEVERAAYAVERALLHPVLRRAARAPLRRREAPVAHRLGDGSLVEGVLDLAFREQEPEGALWTVVDFKTDADISSRMESYLKQVSLYAEAVASATGERARGILLLV
jgi:ATP-dependent exoDNAse (exonuclease V) beta subunit